MRAGPLDDLLDALDDAAATTVRLAAETFAELATASARSTPWARWARMGAEPERLTVTDSGATLRVVGWPAGVWTWAEDGIHPHTIAVRRGGRRRSSSRRRRSSTRPPVLALEGSHPVPGPVHHPGRPGGARAWSKACDQLDARLADLAEQALARAGV